MPLMSVKAALAAGLAELAGIPCSVVVTLGIGEADPAVSAAADGDAVAALCAPREHDVSSNAINAPAKR